MLGPDGRVRPLLFDGSPLLASAVFADTVFAVAFSPNGTTLATGGDDSTVRLWHVSQPSPSTTGA